MKKKQNGMTARTGREKKPYTAPRMEPEILRGDVVLFSVNNEECNLDNSSKEWAPKW